MVVSRQVMPDACVVESGCFCVHQSWSQSAVPARTYNRPRFGFVIDRLDFIVEFVPR